MKQSTEKRKREIKKIECKIRRNATFKKRCQGALKKAKELAVLCDVDVALVISSPDGKLEHFPDRQGTIMQQLIQWFEKHREEDMANLQVSEDTSNGINITTGLDHVNDQQSPGAVEKEMPIPEPQAGNEAGMSGSTLPRWLAEATMASRGGEQVQMQGVPFAGTRGPSSSSVRPAVTGQDTSEARRPLPATLPRWLVEVLASQGGEQLHMPGLPFAGMGDPSSSVQPSVTSQGISEKRGPPPLLNKCLRPPLNFQAEKEVLIQEPQTENEAGMSGATQGREQVQIQGVPFSVIGDPASSSSSVRPSVTGQDTSEVRGPSGASDGMVGGHEMPRSAAEPPSSSYATLPKWLREALASRGEEK